MSIDAAYAAFFLFQAIFTALQTSCILPSQYALPHQNPLEVSMLDVAAPPAGTAPPNEYAYLGLLAQVKKALESSLELPPIDVRDIRPFPNQPRSYFNPESIQRLADSIDAGGQMTSGMVRENPGATRYELIDGERRWRAIQLIPESRRPLYKAKLIAASDEVVQFLISGITNFNRAVHTDIETMETIDRYLSFGLPMREIASLLGISEGWAGQIHGLKKLEQTVLDMLDPTLPKGKKLPLAAAIQISKIDKPYQKALAEQVLSKDITLGRLRGEVIKVAAQANIPIRMREVSGKHQWDSFGNKLDVILRLAGDGEVMLSKGEIDRYILANPETTAEFITLMRDARETLSRISEKILAVRKRASTTT